MMNDLTKKRLKAVITDTAIANALAFSVEPLMRKKIKNNFFHAVVTPTVLLWGLEYAQTKWIGRTIGQQVEGIKVVSEGGGELTSQQILKRIVYRDLISPQKYWKEREKYTVFAGSKFPHDVYANTVVKEIL